MNLTAYPRLFVAIAALQISSVRAADTSCDCTEFPFQPNPPCADVCTAKYMAIAPADDLREVFGLPDDVANLIAKIHPNDRPRRLEDYKYLFLGYLSGQNPKQGYTGIAVQAFEQKVRSLKAEDFKRPGSNENGSKSLAESRCTKGNRKFGSMPPKQLEVE